MIEERGKEQGARFKELRTRKVEKLGK